MTVLQVSIKNMAGSIINPMSQTKVIIIRISILMMIMMISHTFIKEADPTQKYSEKEKKLQRIFLNQILLYAN